jgi:hypothetical protein
MAFPCFLSHTATLPVNDFGNAHPAATAPMAEPINVEMADVGPTSTCFEVQKTAETTPPARKQ